ncbi:putative colanic acid biosynthesis acetyltransferase [Aestuariibaculum marinum]|uniref:Colanic acid biosynthesis acetyltransferase WcaF n=1 Tax=Aestuariibaculum marinum TaxID=2683592 RepID=A0A8J6PYK9_9FLAO|nr:putative colanic acid biosynthesis acetyltransferase [Aestuariibaculum marinum]MBD0823365.1 colanic acid biosynthesis acetyltransferase WcaF [Aestuariibaculum marinum]
MVINQDLSLYKNPTGFRGKPGWFVQIWWLIQSTLFEWSPQFLYGWRRFLLRCFGAKIGKGVVIRPSVKMTYPWKVSIGDYSWIGDEVVLYSLGEIEIGSNVVISQRSYICTGSHDYAKKEFPIYAKKITIEEGCWLATDVFVAPGVLIEKGTVVGARSSVFKDLKAFSVYAGSPAKLLKKRNIE